MDNNKPISILNNSNKGLLVAFIILIISIALIFFGSSLENKNEDIVAKNYDTLIANKQDNTNEYVKINIAYPPYLFELYILTIIKLLTKNLTRHCAGLHSFLDI